MFKHTDEGDDDGSCKCSLCICNTPIRWLLGSLSLCSDCSRKHANRVWFSLLLLSVVLASLLSACTFSFGGNPLPGKPPAVGTPQPREQPINAPHRGFRSMDIWLDVTANTSWQYFDQAKQAISNAIDTMIMPNSDGAVIWISLISHNSYQPQSNIMTLVIPKIESDPLMPLPQPLPAKTGNPFADAAAAKKVEAENKAAYEQWQQTLAHNHQRLAHIRAQVKQQTDQLRALYPAIDPQPPDLWGMVERSAERLQQAQGQKLLLVETSLSQTTWSQFRTGAALWGTRVKVVWNACGSDSTASECQQSSAFWHGVFVHAHATSVRMYDPAQSQTIQDLLD